jgi:hypothetical protein
MSRIKMRNLLNLTEQAPQPPSAMPSPVPAAVAPPTGMNAGGDDQSTPPDAPSPTGPEPEDPSEYDFTRDFRAFEDKKNKAEADAKKVLLDKMNEKLLGKSIVANASRGYGQPKTDYTIKNVKKISVEFWYKDYVVIAADENDKKYFLTPGINIKIEQSETPAPEPGVEQPSTDGQEQPQDAMGGQPSAPGGEEVPNMPQPPEQGGEQMPSGEDGQPAAGGQAPSPQQAPQPQAPQTQPPAPEEDPLLKKKKKFPVAEMIQKDLNKYLLEFMSKSVKGINGKVNFIPYVTETVKMLTENKGSTKIKCKLLIPENHFVSKLDTRDIKLAIAVDSSRNSININKNGRYYLLEYVKEIGMR